MTLAALMRASVGRVQDSLKTMLPSTEDYAVIAAEYADRLFEAFISFASTTGRQTRAYRNEAGRAVLDATAAAFYRGYEDAGGEETEPDDDRWLAARQDAERGYLPGVFDWLAEQRDAETVTEGAVRGRVDAWVSSLQSIYAEGKLRGAKNKMLTWRLGGTEQHCATCARLDGQRHSAKWYLGRNYIPRKPQAAMNCGGWNCDCALVDDNGDEWSE